jgi:hypothetical protein
VTPLRALTLMNNITFVKLRHLAERVLSVKTSQTTGVSGGCSNGDEPQPATE